MRVGFAGAGFIAGVHAETLARQADTPGRAPVGARVAAVFDPNAAHAEAFARTFDAQVAPSFEALLGEVDAVYICAPNAYHAEFAIAALDAGKHVFCEKPMAVSLQEAQRVREAVERARGVYQIGFNKHFAPVYTALKERLDAGELTPRWANLKMNRGELQQPPWVADAALTGGFLYETPIHLLDLGCWLFGPLREVVCRAAQTCGDQLDDFAMLLTFDSGVTATFCSSAHTTWLFPYERVEIYGDHATAVTEEMERITFQLGLDAEPTTLDVTHLPTPERWGYAAADVAFLSAARGEREVVVGVEEAYRAIEAVDACYRAAKTGETVRL
ncbi:MAG: Gfo/Idh/MocA family oxidoreductase [Dehalococcoidia bacterium]